MGQRKYPLLTPAEVQEILRARNFYRKRQEGSHEHWECEATDDRPRSLVTVDVAIQVFREELMKSMIRQSSLTRDEFYSATKSTAKKANLKFRPVL